MIGRETKPTLKMDVNQLFNERFKSFYVLALWHGRLIASSGVLFTIIILFVVGLIYYPSFLDWLPEQWPWPVLFSLFIATAVSRTDHRTFLKEADIMLLLPLENRMEIYFQKTFLYNFMVQGAAIFLLLAIFSPVYVHKINPQDQQLWFYFLVPVLLKGWNLFSSWSALRLASKQLLMIHRLCRFLFSFLFLWWFFSGGSLFIFSGYMIGGILFALIIAAFYLFEKNVYRSTLLPWLALLDMETKLNGRYDSFVQAFVDIPQRQAKIKRREWLAYWTRFLPFQNKMAYTYLYVKTFVRAGSFLGIYFRLTVIGIAFIWFVTALPWKIVVAGMILFITGTQLKGIPGHHQRIFWQSVFPLPASYQRKSFLWLVNGLLSLQALLLSLPLLIDWSRGYSFVIFLGISLACAYVINYAWLNRRGQTGKMKGGAKGRGIKNR